MGVFFRNAVCMLKTKKEQPNIIRLFLCIVIQHQSAIRVGGTTPERHCKIDNYMNIIDKLHLKVINKKKSEPKP